MNSQSIISQLKHQFTQWLLKQPDVTMVAWDMKTDGKKHPMHLSGDKYPIDTGFYQFSLTGPCGYYDRVDEFHGFNVLPVGQVDIFG